MDAIGPKTVSTPDRLVVSTPPVTSAAAATKRSETAPRALELSAVASDVGKGVPVDTQHVEDVRRAVRNGTYPLNPDTIADRMLALKLNWSPKK